MFSGYELQELLVLVDGSSRDKRNIVSITTSHESVKIVVRVEVVTACHLASQTVVLDSHEEERMLTCTLVGGEVGDEWVINDGGSVAQQKEVIASVVPLLVAAPPADEQKRRNVAYIGKRSRRFRKGNGAVEYLYRSPQYVNRARQLGVGTPGKKRGRKCVWLTPPEVLWVCASITTQRKDSKLRSVAAEGGE